MAEASGNVVRIVKDITRCAECGHHEVHQIYTPDSFEHESGLYCQKTPYESNDWAYHTMGTPGPIKFRCVATDDHDVRNEAKIPDWCPLLKNQPQVFTQEEIKRKLIEAGLIRDFFMPPKTQTEEELLESIVRHKPT